MTVCYYKNMKMIKYVIIIMKPNPYMWFLKNLNYKLKKIEK